jgi:hypothetical protein
MKIESINKTEYQKLFDKPDLPYNCVEYTTLFSQNCDEIVYLLIHEDNFYCGLIAGIREKAIYSPFSAPFSIFSFKGKRIDNLILDQLITLVENYALRLNLNAISYILPPYFYNKELISLLIFSFFKHNYHPYIDINQYYSTSDFIQYETNTINKEIRYKLRAAEKAGLTFQNEIEVEGIEKAFNVIYQNKIAKGRIQRLSLEQILALRNIIDIDFFTVNYEMNPIASSIVYRIKPGIVQVIYWGNIIDYNNLYPMNYLAMNMFRFYKDQKIEIVDLGTSMSDREINQGLYRFKESIGASSTIKYTFSKSF